METTDNTNNVHIGQNIKRIREIKGIKQETLAIELGGEWNQSKVSLLEGRESIEEDLLKQVAEILNVTPEMIEKYDEKTVNNFFSNTFHDTSVNNGPLGYVYQCTFNPLDKVVELYERLLKSEAANRDLPK
ncbi:Helix-turn-helix domain-containing protein [Pedobacter terrae]|uniref:Helix-turn-helix domain-containing protein n=1 Tax=Pedobacter terrae TaxID=405671 RepID=A0A1G7QC58_9SPHI|nr:helix-turn-helix transcriptional regulator [Pedobacter terrae]SDF96084.1 Helix-turn-helix domain-containing protein [Pedobacter terrae]